MKNVRAICLLGLSLSLAACGSTPSSVTASTSDLATQGVRSETAARYLVGFKAGKGVDRKAISRAGGQLGRSFDRIEAASVTLTPSAAQKLASDPSVEYVERVELRYQAGGPAADTDGLVSIAGTTLGKPGGTLGGLNATWSQQGEITYGDQALNVPQLYGMNQRGAGIGVCVVDTGIDGDHPELAAALKGYKNFVLADSPQRDDPFTNDVNGHGTHVSGTIAAQLGSESSGLLHQMTWQGGVLGVAPSVNLYAARVLGDTGYGTTEDVIAGVLWCAGKVALGEERHMVINMSLGSGKPKAAAEQYETRTERRAMQAAYDMGALLVGAAGNDASKEPHYPSDHPSVIKVGAVNAKGDLASFSNYNSKQELVAPGDQVLSSVPVGFGRDGSVSVPGFSFASMEAATGSAVSSVTGVITATATASNQLCGVGTIDATLSGKIALISRGTCTFAEKVTNAVNSGAIGAIIYNNRAGDFGADLGSDKSIPVVTILQADGQALLQALTASTTGSLSVKTADYAYYGGTSMATPHVSGAAALVWAAKPNLTNEQLRKLLSDTATDLGPNGRDNFFGNGLVNPLAAIQTP
ncbi:S8 family serine peptidase [Deinococcus yavapaiensis]|uniref:Subtilisin family serine protease n=1 Tax=Deinococcus yavapaiensis KR-236 TaxID=694435 RepID=A0A318S613_9DEIO|nr:S8 family serine peptidase [Deinococcus yavapaiensis]PYE51834.1 subtilisin family serine protease [Deinococcus yavapaiensis KR-236]